MTTLSYDLIQNKPESNVILGKLISGEIKILELFTLEEGLSRRVRSEAMALVTQNVSHGLSEGHPTFDYVKAQDPTWKPKAGSIHQFSLYNSRHDFFHFGDDHHWIPHRWFHRDLKAIPEFMTTYFAADLQNCRLQGIMSNSGLGLHRERIVAIPGRPHDYKLRFHLPISTSPEVEFTMDGQAFQMELGRVYLFNQSCLHGVQNGSPAYMRVHLVWDLYLTDSIIEMIQCAL